MKTKVLLAAALLLLLGLYLAFPDKVFVFDGAFFSVAIERHVADLRSVMLNPRHLLFLAFFVALRDFLVAVHLPVGGYELMQRVNAVFGVLGVWLFFRLLLRLTRDEAVAGVCALLFGVTYAYWSRATEGQVYLLMTVGALATTWAACALVSDARPRRVGALVLLWLLACLFHAANAALLPVVAGALWAAWPRLEKGKSLALTAGILVPAALACLWAFHLRTPAALLTFLANDFGGRHLAARTGDWLTLARAFFTSGGLSLPARTAQMLRMFCASLAFSPLEGPGPALAAVLLMAAPAAALWRSALEPSRLRAAALVALAGLSYAFLDSFWQGGMFFWGMPAAAFVALAALCWARSLEGAEPSRRRRQLGLGFFLVLALGGWNLRAGILPQSRLENNAGYPRALFVRDHTVSTCWVVMSGLGFPNSKVYLTRFAQRSNRALEYFVDPDHKQDGLAVFQAFLREAMSHGLPVYALSDLVDDQEALEGVRKMWGVTPEEIRACFGPGRFLKIAEYDRRLRLFLFVPEPYQAELFAGLAFNVLDMGDIARIREAAAVMAQLGAGMTPEERRRAALLLEQSNYGALLAFSGMAPFLSEQARAGALEYARRFQHPPAPNAEQFLTAIYSYLGIRRER